MKIHVAVGVIKGKKQDFLIALRPKSSHQGGLWEFPGGKLKEGETPLEALKRELFEELSIKVTKAEPLISLSHDYHDKLVSLDVWSVCSYEGFPRGNEGQLVRWVPKELLKYYEFPLANQPIIDLLSKNEYPLG